MGLLAAAVGPKNPRNWCSFNFRKTARVYEKENLGCFDISELSQNTSNAKISTK